MKKVSKLKTLKIILFLIITIISISTTLNNHGSDNFYAQNPKLDSLWKVYKTAKHDTTRIKLLNEEIGYLYESINPDSAILFYNKAIKLVELRKKLQPTNNKQYLSLEAKSLRYIGFVYLNLGLNDRAIEYFRNSLRIFEEIGDKLGISNCFMNIGNIHSEQGTYAQAIEYHKKALKLKEDINDKSGMSNCYGNIGIVYYYQGTYSLALEYFSKSLMICEDLGNKIGKSACYNNIANVYKEQGIYDHAINYYHKSLKIAEDFDDKSGMSNCLNNIGLVYKEQGIYKKAIEYYHKSLKIYEIIGNKSGISACYNNIGIIYKNQGDLNQAIDYYLKSLKIKEELNDRLGMSNCYGNIGNIYDNQNNYNKAIEYYLKSLKIKEELRDKNGINRVWINLGSLNLSLADLENVSKNLKNEYLKNAVNYATKAIMLAKEINAIPMENDAANILIKAYKKLGNFKKSIEYAEIYIATKDSMFSEEKTKSLAEMGAKYESEKRELTIQKLEKEQLLQNETIARKNAESKKQRILIFSFLAGFVIILVFSIFLYRLFIQKKIANVILSQQKEEISAQRDEIETQRDLVTEQKEHIEEIHKEVTDSINYAERIQRSFLATKELLDENLNEYFVFFHPKDVVSGDFYWAGKLNNGNFALATADSTGHGVPGAIMSILNISSLEKAIESGICEPSEILNHTRKTIIERLKKDGSPDGGKDGMDASLISFDFVNQKLTYSAANNAIWIVRNTNLQGFQNLGGFTYEPEVHVTGEDASANFKPQTSNVKLFELTPDKMPIGKHDKDQISFTQQTFQLQKGDVIYTLTDGFPDQFGGPKGKKFMSKNLKQLLIANCHLTMEEQKQVLEKTLVDWIGKGEQIDDITIIGIKI